MKQFTIVSNSSSRAPGIYMYIHINKLKYFKISLFFSEMGKKMIRLKPQRWEKQKSRRFWAGEEKTDPSSVVDESSECCNDKQWSGT